MKNAFRVAAIVSHRANGALVLLLLVLGCSLYQPPAKKGNSFAMLDLLHDAAWAQCKVEGAKRVAGLLR